jgi:hypothetical protein
MNGNCPGNQPGDQARKYGTPSGTATRGADSPLDSFEAGEPTLMG